VVRLVERMVQQNTLREQIMDFRVGGVGGGWLAGRLLGWLAGCVEGLVG
jgi:hypothetical protein